MTDIIFTPVSHDHLVEGVQALAQAIADWSPHLLVGVGRGGLVPAVYLSHRTGLPLVSIDYSAGLPAFAMELIPALAARTHSGERLLFVEDINDSGKTIAALRQALSAASADMGQVRFAVLTDNVRSREKVDYSARTIDRHVTKDWFVFPWEALAPHDAVAAEAQADPERLA
jgi:uncharacterized protein